MTIQENVNRYFMEHEIYHSKMIDLCVDLMSRVEDFDGDEYEAVNEVLDEGLIYHEDMWTVLMFYCNPEEADWDYAEREFTDFLADIYRYIAENTDDEEDDEDDEEDDE